MTIRLTCQIFGLSQLEILDISRNDLKNVSDDIESLKVLRVLSISHNNVKDLPICLAGIVTLRMLRLDGNPWKPEIEEMIRAAEATYSPTTPARPDDSERDRHITAVIVEYLRKKQISIDEYGYAHVHPHILQDSLSTVTAQLKPLGHSLASLSTPMTLGTRQTDPIQGLAHAHLAS